MRVGSAFRRMKGFHFQYAFCLPPAVHLDQQVTVPGFLNVFCSNPWKNNLFYEKRRQFGLADRFQRFNNNESEEVCRFILWFLFWQVFFSFFIWRRHRCRIFFAGPVLYQPPWSLTYVGNVPWGGGPIRFGWDRDTRPVYSSWNRFSCRCQFHVLKTGQIPILTT